MSKYYTVSWVFSFCCYRNILIIRWDINNITKDFRVKYLWQIELIGCQTCKSCISVCSVITSNLQFVLTNLTVLIFNSYRYSFCWMFTVKEAWRQCNFSGCAACYRCNLTVACSNGKFIICRIFSCYSQCNCIVCVINLGRIFSIFFFKCRSHFI